MTNKPRWVLEEGTWSEGTMKKQFGYVHHNACFTAQTTDVDDLWKVYVWYVTFTYMYEVKGNREAMKQWVEDKVKELDAIYWNFVERKKNG